MHAMGAEQSTTSGGDSSIESSIASTTASSVQNIDAACRPVGNLLNIQSLSSNMQTTMAGVTTTCGSAKGCKETCGKAGNRATDTVRVDLSFLTQQFFPPQNILEEDNKENRPAFVECGGVAAALAAGTCPAAGSLLSGEDDGAEEAPSQQGGRGRQKQMMNDMPGGGPEEEQVNPRSEEELITSLRNPGPGMEDPNPRRRAAEDRRYREQEARAATQAVDLENRRLDEEQERRLAALRAEQAKLAKELEELKRQQQEAQLLRTAF